MKTVELIFKLEDDSLEVDLRYCYKLLLKVEGLKTLSLEVQSNNQNNTLADCLKRLSEHIDFKLTSKQITMIVGFRNLLAHNLSKVLRIKKESYTKEAGIINNFVEAVKKYYESNQNENNEPKDNDITDMSKAKNLLGGISFGSKTNIME